MNTIKVPIKSIKVGDVVIIASNICIVTDISCALESKTADESQKCNMKVTAIDSNVCCHIVAMK